MLGGILRLIDINLREGLLACLRVFQKDVRKKLLLIGLFQSLLSFLDVVGVGLVGILTALGISGLSSNSVGGKVNFVLHFLGIQSLGLTSQVVFLGILATVLLLTKTILSILFTKRTLKYLSQRGALLSSQLMRQVLSQSLNELNSRTNQETIFAVTSGVDAITLRVIAPFISIAVDAFLLTLVSVSLFALDPKIAFANCIIFGVLGIALNRIMRMRARDLGSNFASLEILSNQKILEILLTFKESVVRSTRNFYGFQIEKLRLEMSLYAAELAFLPNISKYVIETAVVLGGLLIAAIQFATEDAIHAVTGLSIFIAAGSRIAPAILRMQQNSLTLNSGLGASGRTLKLISELPDYDEVISEEFGPIFDHRGFLPVVELEKLQFTYPGSLSEAVRNVTLKVSPGEFVALVGPSGAGKTTLIDLILGLLKPNSGTVNIAKMKPAEAIARWPGAVAYVPQDTHIVDGTFGQNITLGYEISEADYPQIESAAKTAALADFLEKQTKGLGEDSGDRGLRISGGQRQRLGIARAIFTSPKLIILDEATSSLDSVTENLISNALMKLRGDVTLIVIAHRLSTIVNADQVVYMEEGKIIANGSFTEVKNQVPNFAEQARLMGI